MAGELAAHELSLSMDEFYARYLVPTMRLMGQAILRQKRDDEKRKRKALRLAQKTFKGRG